MTSSSTRVTIPNLQISLEEFLAVIRQLDEPARVRVAQVLTETAMEQKLADLIQQLANTPPSDHISDADIEAEIRATRQTQG
jgi:hypothetical protein